MALTASGSKECLPDQLVAQYRYFAYRTLDCVSHLVTGMSREPALFDEIALAYARLLNLNIQHSSRLPSFDEVNPATEAICALLFHCALVTPLQFRSAFDIAYQSGFGELVNQVLRIPAGEPYAELQELMSMFERAMGLSLRPRPARNEGHWSGLEMQILELCEGLPHT